MKIRITQSKKISAVQKEFSKMFPYLKLEFFSRGHKRGESSLKKHMLDSNLTIGSNFKKNGNDELVIVPSMTVAELESAFAMCGISVQVFRKARKVWLETTVTDEWTLEKQNSMGRAFSNGFEEISGR